MFARYNGHLGKQATTIALSCNVLNVFLSDNAHLDLLNAAKSVPLATHFRDILCWHATQLNSTSETGIDSSEFSLQLPAKYTPSVLDSHEVQLVRET